MYNNLPALTESILWDEKLIAADYAPLSEETLHSALQSYLQAVGSNRHEDECPIRSPLSLWMTHFDQLALYRPGLLSAERIILPDALEEAALRLGGTDLALAVDLLVQNRHTDRLDNIRRHMARFVRFVREHFALIQAGFILFTPSESVRQEQQRKVGFTDENAGRSFLSSVMPQAIAEFYTRSLKVKGVERVSEEGHIRFVPENRLPGEIMLELKDCQSPFTNGHIFQDMQPVSKNADGSITVAITRGNLRNRNHYEHWVRGAVNRSLYYHYLNLLTELSQSDRTGASLAVSVSGQSSGETGGSGRAFTQNAGD